MKEDKQENDNAYTMTQTLESKAWTPLEGRRSVENGWIHYGLLSFRIYERE